MALAAVPPDPLVLGACGLVIEPGIRIALLAPTREGDVIIATGTVELLDVDSAADPPRTWVHWRDGAGRLHASPPTALRVEPLPTTRIGPAEASIAIHAIRQILKEAK